MLKPQIAILDIDMPRLNGLETIRAIRELPFPVKVIILTMYKEEDMFNAAMDSGSEGLRAEGKCRERHCGRAAKRWIAAKPL